MAFDQSSLPKDLRPLNVSRTVAPDTTSGRAHNPPRPDVVSPQSVAVYYPDGLPAAGYMNLGTGPMGPPSNASVSSSGYSFSPNYAARPSGDGAYSDQASEEDSVGRKVKFLCSFGGKILPRPSDGTLRYVGGHTRIISVRKGVTFAELVHKMVDVYGQSVVIKYQLPYEDLDALVSVSCPEDLANMMEEYDRLLESSPDGSVKLRVFLFSVSEADAAGSVQLEDMNKYVDAVNGVGDVGITRKGSIASTQNSDVSGTEGFDGVVGQEVTTALPPSSSMFSPRSDSAASQENASRLETSAPALVVPTVVAPHSAPLQPDFEGLGPAAHLQTTGQQQFLGYDLQQTSMNFPPPPSHYIGGHHDAYTCSQVVYTNPQVSAAPRPMMFPSQSMMAQPFIPSSSHLSIYPSMGQQPVQQHRVLGVSEQSYSNVYPAPVGGGYNWRPAAPQDHSAFSDRWRPSQHVFPRTVDCYMCQKALPHAHSDTVVQDQRDSRLTTVSDTNPMYHSLRSDDASRIHAVTALNQGVMGISGDASYSVATPNQAVIGLSGGDVQVPYNVATPNHGVMGISSDVQTPYSGNAPGSRAEGAIQQHLITSSQPKPDILVSKPVTGDSAPVVAPTYQLSEQLIAESPKNHPGKVPGSAFREEVVRPAISHDNARPVDFISHESARPVDFVSHENARPVDLLMDNLQIKPPDFLPGNEHSKSPIDQFRKDDISEHAPPQTLGKDVLPNVACTRPSPVPLHVQDMNPTWASEVPPCSVVEASQQHNVCLTDPFGGLQSNPPVADLISPSNDLMDNATQFSAGHNTDNVTLNSNVDSSVSPHNWGAMVTDSENSLFSNQDPWNMRPEAHFPPPKPTKITMKREPSAKELHVGETNLNSEPHLEDSAKPISEQGQTQTGKGLAEDRIKQQLQATAEGVASSVLHPSNAEVSSQETSVLDSDTGHAMEGQNSEAHIQSKMEAMNIKPEKANLGFAMSDSMGRLQIIKNSDLEELRELGSGTFGTVYHGKWRGTDVAIKRINERCFSAKVSEGEHMKDDFWNEAIKLADLHHPNVVAFYGVVLDGPGGSVATVTEFMVNGSLRNALVKNERNLDKRKRLLIAMDVAFGMEYLHSRNIVHFDIKSDNLLVNLRDPHRPICKVGDLGLSKVKCQTLISGGVRGTLPWMAPELLNGGSSLVSDKVDVFSFGIVLWELLTGLEPYAELHYGAIIGGIVNNTLRPPVPENCDPDWRTLMERCWSAEPAERPSFTEIANDLRAMAAKLPPKGQTAATNTKTSP